MKDAYSADMEDNDSERVCTSDLRNEYVVQSRSTGDRRNIGDEPTDGECGVASNGPEPRTKQVLSQAKWSGLEVSAIVLRLLLKTFDTGRPLVFGVDETIERRRGEKIAAKGIYRDPVRSSIVSEVRRLIFLRATIVR